MSKYYVYTLAYPAEMGGRVFYVGKGTGDRMHAHEYRVRHGGVREASTHDICTEIVNLGGTVVATKVFETDDEKLAYKKEREFIVRYGRKNLANRHFSGVALSWFYRDDKLSLQEAANAVGLTAGAVLSLAHDMFLADHRRFMACAQELGVEIPDDYLPDVEPIENESL